MIQLAVIISAAIFLQAVVQGQALTTGLSFILMGFLVSLSFLDPLRRTLWAASGEVLQGRLGWFGELKGAISYFAKEMKAIRDQTDA